MGLKSPDSHRLYSLQELIRGRCTLGLPFRDFSITLTGQEVAVVKAAVNGEGRGDVVSSFDSYLCFDEKLMQTLLWEPYPIQPTPETERDRRLRAHGGMFGAGWLRLLLDLAPEDATYSAQGLGTWIATAELALDLGFDEHDTRSLLTSVAQSLNGEVNPDVAVKKTTSHADDLDEEDAPKGGAEQTKSGFPWTPDDVAEVVDGSPPESSPAGPDEPPEAEMRPAQDEEQQAEAEGEGAGKGLDTAATDEPGGAP